MYKNLFCALLVSTLALPVVASDIGAYGDSSNTITVQPTDKKADKDVKGKVSPAHAKAYDALSSDQKKSVQAQSTVAGQHKKIETHTQANQKNAQNQIKSYHQSQMNDLKKSGKKHLNGSNGHKDTAQHSKSPCKRRNSSY